MNRKLLARMLTSAALCCVMASVIQAQPAPFDRGSAEPDSSALSLIYDPQTGYLEATAPENFPLTALELRSSSLFLPNGCASFDGLFDVCTKDKLFKLDSNGYSHTEFGEVLPANMSVDDLLTGLVVDGASVGGGFQIGTGAIIVHSAVSIPEPLSISMFVLGLLGAVPIVRFRR